MFAEVTRIFPSRKAQPKKLIFSQQEELRTMCAVGGYHPLRKNEGHFQVFPDANSGFS